MDENLNREEEELNTALAISASLANSPNAPPPQIQLNQVQPINLEPPALYRTPISSARVNPLENQLRQIHQMWTPGARIYYQNASNNSRKYGIILNKSYFSYLRI